VVRSGPHAFVCLCVFCGFLGVPRVAACFEWFGMPRVFESRFSGSECVARFCDFVCFCVFLCALCVLVCVCVLCVFCVFCALFAVYITFCVWKWFEWFGVWRMHMYVVVCYAVFGVSQEFLRVLRVLRGL